MAERPWDRDYESDVVEGKGIKKFKWWNLRMLLTYGGFLQEIRTYFRAIFIRHIVLYYEVIARDKRPNMTSKI